jgi:5'-nucleotidase
VNYQQAPYEHLRQTGLKDCRILLSNDDGIHAPGMQILEEVARELSDDVWVVAPKTEQSAASHSLTIHEPLRITQEGEQRYSVSGTPTDAVLMAMKIVFAEDKKPDLLLSGINLGGNLGEDVTYSGTIAAAMEGTLLDIPSIALSQCVYNYNDVPWDVARFHAASVIRQLCHAPWQANSLLNVNFPPTEASGVKGLRPAPHGRRKIGEKLIKREDPKGRPYYWIGSDRWDKSEWQGSDISVINDGYISVTPLSMDLTEYKALEGLREGLEHDAAMG